MFYYQLLANGFPHYYVLVNRFGGLSLPRNSVTVAPMCLGCPTTLKSLSLHYVLFCQEKRPGFENFETAKMIYRAGASFIKELSKNFGLSSSLSEKFTLIPYYKILSLYLRYFMKPLSQCSANFDRKVS